MTVRVLAMLACLVVAAGAAGPASAQARWPADSPPRPLPAPCWKIPHFLPGKSFPRPSASPGKFAFTPIRITSLKCLSDE